jgi:hypothetical protein
MLPGFNPNVGFPIYPVSWIVLTETYQDGQDFWNKLGSPVILSQGTAEEQAVPTTHNLTVSAGSNGAVDPNGLVIVDQGASQLFTAISDVGYEVDAWLVDDSPVQSGGLEYTLSNISVDHTVLVTFKPLIFAVTASTGSNGLISPNGVVNADYKSDQLFTAMPDIHYDVDIWYVDGNPVQTGGLEYTLSDIQTNHTVSVTFKQVPLNILFIGNSFTGHGPIPLVVRSIAVSAGWEAPNVTNHSSDAQDLDFYSADPNTLALIDQGGWDYVVLQEYSTLPTDNAGYPEGFKTAATSLYDSVKASNPQAQVVLYETWARHEDHEIYPITFTDPNQMYLQLQTHYHDCADNYIPSHSTALRKTDVSVSPVGEAWHANTLDQNLMLHNVDLYHANSRGQYLSSLVLYSMIYGRMVAGLSPQLGVSDADTIYLQSLCDSVTGQTIPQVGSEPNTLEVGETIYIDFGSYLSTTPGNWNNVSSTDGGINRAVTSSGTPTTVNILIPDRFSEFNANGTIVPDPVLNLPAEATKDTFYGNDIEVEPGGSVEPIAQLVISNLDPNLLYDLSFFASRIGVSDNRQTEYAVSGNGGLAHTLHLNPSNNTNTIVRGSNVRPTSTGDIVIDIQKGPQNDNVSGFYYLGTLTIKAKELLYLVAASAGPNGSINPNGGVSIGPGDSQLFTAASDADYDVNQWSVDGSLMQTGGTEFTLSDVAADHTVSVTFRHIADLQVDGVINVNDLQILCDNWLTAVSPDIDIHDDGKMDLLDFSILAKHWLDDGIPSIIVP